MASRSKIDGIFPDLVLTNGKIITVDEKFSIAQAVAVKNGKIVVVGTNDEVKPYQRRHTQVLDLKGKTVLPGINDAHIHASLLGGTLPPVAFDVSSIRTSNDILNSVAIRVKSTRSGEWVRGVGLDSVYMSFGKGMQRYMPTRWELDRISPDNPVYIGVAPFHGMRVALLNTRALELAGIQRDTLSPPGGEVVKDPVTGEPTGLLVGEPAEALIASVVPFFTREQKRQAIVAAINKLNSLGITSFTEPSLGPGAAGLYGGLWDNEVIHLYNDLCNAGELTARVSILLLFTPYGTFQPEKMYAGLTNTGIHTGFGNEWLRIGGIKLYADGIPPMKTAWMSEEYPGGGNGKLVFPGNNNDERCRELQKIVAFAHNLGFQVGIHATGERSVSACVTSFVNAELSNPKNLRHYIIHGDFVTPADADLMSKNEIGVSVQPALAAAFSQFMGFTVGKERAQRHLSIQTLLKRGVHVSGGSDSPVISPDWRQGIQSAVLRQRPDKEVFGADQKVSLPEAIRMYTLEGAWQDHMDHLKGSLEPGKLADFCILDEDILAAEPERIKDIRILMTIVGGKIVYNDGL